MPGNGEYTIDKSKLTSFLDKYVEDDRRIRLGGLLEEQADVIIDAIQNRGIKKAYIINGLLASSQIGSSAGWNLALMNLFKRRGLKYVGNPIPHFESIDRVKNKRESRRRSLREDIRSGI